MQLSNCKHISDGKILMNPTHFTEEEKGKPYFNLLNRIFGSNNDILPYNLINSTNLMYEIDLILKEIEGKPSRPTQKNPDANVRIKKVLVLRFGLSGSKPMTLAAIAEELYVSMERVRQIEYQALEIMRQPNNRNKLKKFRNNESL